jgi:hypothetical protein
MADQNINIHLVALDEATSNLNKVQTSLQKMSENTRQFGLQLRQAGREMSFMGTSMMMAGATITAPLAAAYAQAGKYSAAVSSQIWQMQNVMNNLSVSIGTALLPVMKQLTDQVARAVDWWNSLDAATRDRLVQDVFKLGETLVGLGAAFMIVGRSLTFLANLDLLVAKLLVINPAVLIGAAAFLGLAFAMWKCKEAADAILNTLQALTKYSFIGMAISGMFGKSPDQMFGAQGSWAKGFDDFKKQITDVMDAINGVGASSGTGSTGSPGNFFTGFQLGLEQSKQALADWSATGLKAAKDLFSGMQSDFQGLFYDAFTGQLKSAQDYFKAWGEQILKIFSDVLAQMVTKWMQAQMVQGFGNLFGSLFGFGNGHIGSVSGYESIGKSDAFVNVGAGTVSSPFLHSGGMIRAHSGLAVDEVPIIAQTGEGILSRRGMSNLARLNNGGGMGGGSISPVIVIKAWDFSDVAAHASDIEAVMINALQKNGAYRMAQKKYS